MIHDGLDDLDRSLQGVIEGISFAADTYDSAATSLSVLDRLEAMQHLGVRIDYPSTADAGLSPGDPYQGQWVHDQVDLTLIYKLRVKGQLESRRLAFGLARQIRLAVTGAPELQRYRPTYIRERRIVPSTGWVQITQEYRFKRDQAVR